MDGALLTGLGSGLELAHDILSWGLGRQLFLKLFLLGSSFKQ